MSRTSGLSAFSAIGPVFLRVRVRDAVPHNSDPSAAEISPRADLHFSQGQPVLFAYRSDGGGQRRDTTSATDRISLSLPLSGWTIFQSSTVSQKPARHLHNAASPGYGLATIRRPIFALFAPIATRM